MPALADTPLPVKTTSERAAVASASAASTLSDSAELCAAAARTAAARRGRDLIRAPHDVSALRERRWT
jgi:hypothetical protein